MLRFLMLLAFWLCIDLLNPGDIDFVPNPSTAQVEGPLQRASVGGKYRNLLREIKVPQDAQQYTNFNDFGSWNGTDYAGYNNLPQGYWVYVYPHWYIWQESTEKRQ